MRILITRPAHLAQKLSQTLNHLGHSPEILPVIEFAPTPHQKKLLDGIRNLDRCDIIIFTSQAAVHYGMVAIQKYWSSLPPSLRWICIGPGTQAALQQLGIKTIHIPENPPFESESLLNLALLQNISNLNIKLFRGNGGRALLPETLKARGAKLDIIECYQRRIPIIDEVDRMQRWSENPIDVTFISSEESLHNLKQIMGSAWSMICEIPMIVASERIYSAAKALGVQQIITARGASDASFVEVLTELKLTQ